MSGQVIQMPASDTLTADQAIASAAKAGFTDVLCLGYVGGDLFWRTSQMTKAETLWLLEKMRKYLLEATE